MCLMLCKNIPIQMKEERLESPESNRGSEIATACYISGAVSSWGKGGYNNHLEDCWEKCTKCLAQNPAQRRADSQKFPWLKRRLKNQKAIRIRSKKMSQLERASLCLRALRQRDGGTPWSQNEHQTPLNWENKRKLWRPWWWLHNTVNVLNVHLEVVNFM